MINSNIGPNLAPLRDIRLWNPSDLDLDLLRSFKVKSNTAVGLSIYEFLSVSNSNHKPHVYLSPFRRHMRLKIFSLSLIIGPKFCRPSPQAHPYPRAIFLKIESLYPWVQGKPPMENEVECSNTFWARLLTDTHTHTQTDRRTDTRSDRNKPLAGFNHDNQCN